MPAVRKVLLTPTSPITGGQAPCDFPSNERVFDLVFDHYRSDGSTIATSPKLINQALKVVLPFDIAVKIKLVGCPDKESVILKNRRADGNVLRWSEGDWKSINDLLPLLEKFTTDEEKKLNLVFKS